MEAVTILGEDGLFFLFDFVSEDCAGRRAGGAIEHLLARLVVLNAAVSQRAVQDRVLAEGHIFLAGREQPAMNQPDAAVLGVVAAIGAKAGAPLQDPQDAAFAHHAASIGIDGQMFFLKQGHRGDLGRIRRRLRGGRLTHPLWNFIRCPGMRGQQQTQPW